MQLRRYSGIASPVVALALCSLLAEPGEPDAPEFLPASDSPLGATSRLLASYRTERLEEYAALLLPDFRFTFADSETRAAHPEGFSREDEIASARHLFEGFTDAAGVDRPAARLIETSLDTVCASGDPEKPDSAEQYQLVVACGMRLRIELEDGTELEVGPQCHEMHFVRGDAAARGPDQPGDADHWYLARWTESPLCEASEAAAWLASRPPPSDRGYGKRVVPGGRSAVEAPEEPGPPVVLRVPNPAHGVVSVWLRLPGKEPATLHMFDVAGRRVLERDLGASSEIERRFEIAGTSALPAGLYWLRLTQGARVGPARAVVLR